MKIYICHDVKEKEYLYKNGIKCSVTGSDPITKERYWVYNQTEYVETLLNNFRKGD